MTPCPICRSGGMTTELDTSMIRCSRCAECGHRVIAHKWVSRGSAGDYHLQYDQDGFLPALAATRKRQALLVLEALRRAGGTDRILDIGAGQGWFLETCREAGVAMLAGVDGSSYAVGRLQAQGIGSHLVDLRLLATPGEEKPLLGSAVGFPPAVVTLLDVLEHFDRQQPAAMLRRVLREFRDSLALVAVKVPVSRGLLFRACLQMARLSATGPFYQLLQVGLVPAHFHYFSVRSLRRLLHDCDLEIVEEIGDPDFEPNLMKSRVRALGRVPGFLVVPFAHALRGIIRFLAVHDSWVVIARPT